MSGRERVERSGERRVRIGVPSIYDSTEYDRRHTERRRSQESYDEREGVVSRLNALHARMVKAHASNEDLLTVLAAIDEMLAQRQRAEECERVFTKLCDTTLEAARAPMLRASAGQRGEPILPIERRVYLALLAIVEMARALTDPNGGPPPSNASLAEYGLSATAIEELFEAYYERAITERDARTEPLSNQTLNDILAWLDNDGNELADDAIVKLASATGRPFSHVTAGWLKRFITATNGTRFGDCPQCGRHHGDHTPNEQDACDRARVPTDQGSPRPLGWNESEFTGPGSVSDV